MTFKTGSWGIQAKKRAKKRNAYFYTYNKKRDPIKMKARRAVEYALKMGRLKKKKCAVCRAIKVTAHHPDYSKPLDVIWLCPKHHRGAHKTE